MVVVDVRDENGVEALEPVELERHGSAQMEDARA